MSTHKIERISSDISKNISNIIANEASDTLLKTITITGCVVTKDLSFAKVYFTSLSDLTKEEITKEVNEASRYIRGKLSECVDIRHTPALKFIYDESVAYG
ncbi:MAG: 30S ribosome-binding factor RbfA, partial [Bacilli bacterium]